MSRGLRLFAIGAASLALVLGAPEDASAQARGGSGGGGERAATDTRARELFQKGDTAYAEGKYEEALAAFQEAYDLSGRPQLLFNISNALERLGRYSEAVDALEKYLASGKAKDRDVVQKRLASVKKRADDQKREAEQKAKDEEERRAREAEERKKASDASRAPSGGDRTPPPPKSDFPVLPVALLAGGGALFVTGGVFGVLTLSARSDAKNGCSDGAAGKLCSDDSRDALSREKTFGIIADVGMISGLVLGGLGAYLLLSKTKGVGATMTPRTAEAPARVTTGKSEVSVTGHVVGRPGGGGVELVGTF